MILDVKKLFSLTVQLGFIEEEHFYPQQVHSYLKDQINLVEVNNNEWGLVIIVQNVLGERKRKSPVQTVLRAPLILFQ